MMSQRRRRGTSLAPAVRPGLAAGLNVSAEGAARVTPGIVQQSPGKAGVSLNAMIPDVAPGLAGPGSGRRHAQASWYPSNVAHIGEN